MSEVGLKDLAKTMVDVVVEEEEIDVKDISALPEDIKQEARKELEAEDICEDEKRLVEAGLDSLEELTYHPAFSYGNSIYLKYHDIEKLGKEVRRTMNSNFHRRLTMRGLFSVTDLEMGFFAVMHECAHTLQTDHEKAMDQARAIEEAIDRLTDLERDKLEEMAIRAGMIKKIAYQGPDEAEDELIKKFKKILDEEMYETETEKEADQMGAEMVFTLRQITSDISEEDLEEAISYLKEVF